MPEKEKILNFWFKECKPEQWFKKKEDFDQIIENFFCTKKHGENDNMKLKSL